MELSNKTARQTYEEVAYETDPRQLEHVNALAREFRRLTWPVVWRYGEFRSASAGEILDCFKAQSSAQGLGQGPSGPVGTAGAARRP